MEFQIRSTISSWSFCWNRGDIVGYCDAYYNCNNNQNDEKGKTRYVSVSRHGNMTCLIGATHITKFLTRAFKQCAKYQTKHQSIPHESSNGAVAGYLEYNQLQIQCIPSSVTTTTTIMNHAMVFGHYTLEFSPNNIRNEQGIFTLHLIQRSPTSSQSSSLSSQWYIQSEHSSALSYPMGDVR